MGIKIDGSDTTILKIEINNGDLNVLNEIMQKWHFVNRESAIRFALGVLKITDSGSLYQGKPDGTKVVIQPADGLVNKPEA